KVLPLVLAIAGVSLVGFFFVSVPTEPGRSSPLQRLGPWLWRGAFGRLVFRAADRGLPADSTRTSPGTVPGVLPASPASVLDTSATARLHDLRSLGPGLERLEAMFERSLHSSSLMSTGAPLMRPV